MINYWKKLPDYGYYQLMGYMSAADDENAPDGARRVMLDDAAGSFAKDRNIEIDTNEAVQQYIRWKADNE